MAGFLAAAGYSHYLYAPKGDASLRSQWREPFDDLSELRSLAAACHEHGLAFGVGLSPIGLQIRYTDADRKLLAARVGELSSIGLDVLWVLFDDMRGDLTGIATTQCQVMADVRAMFDGQLAVCPSYYSFDPVLDEVFGQRPPGYLEQLAAGLCDPIDILWTGNQVVSPAISPEDCQRFTEKTGRKPLLWDNYPVNDGRKTSPFLHLAPFAGRAGLKPVSAGHFANPMNQPNLSKIPLSTLPALVDGYTDEAVLMDRALAQLPEALSRLIARDSQRFQSEGLDAICADDKQALKRDYQQIEHPMADEVVDWLGGGYVFDPDCLTG